MNTEKRSSFLLAPAVTALLLMLTALLCLVPGNRAYAEGSSDDVVGSLSVVSMFDIEGGAPVYDGHAFLVFTSYEDDLKLHFSSVSAGYTMTDEFAKLVDENAQELSYKTVLGELLAKYYPGTTVEEYIKVDDLEHYRDYPKVQAYIDEHCWIPSEDMTTEEAHHRTTNFDLTVNAGEFFSFGNFTLQYNNKSMAKDALLNSALIGDLKKAIGKYMQEGHTVEGIVDEIAEIFSECINDPEATGEDLKEALQGYLVEVLGEEGCNVVFNDFLSKRGCYDGATYGGVYVNRDMWRQKSWEDWTPNKVISVDITRSQLNSMMNYFNTGVVNSEVTDRQVNRYSVAVHNCSSVASIGWNAAVGFVQDANGNNTAEKSGLYLDAGDETFSFLKGAFDTPKKICEVAEEWAKTKSEVTVESWDVVREIPRCTVTFDTNGHGSNPGIQILKIGQKATQPKVSAPGYKLLGWYTDQQCTKPYDFTTSVREDTALYAKWAVDNSASAKQVMIAKGVPSKGSVKASWTAIKGASSYVVYAGYCGGSMKKLAKTSKTTLNVKKLFGKKLKKGKNVRFYVVAYGKKSILAKTPVAYVVMGTSKTYANAKKVTVAKAALTLRKGKTAKANAKVVLAKGKKQLGKKYANSIRYYTTNKKVATVNASGKITAVGGGTCTVYAVALNGKCAKIKVTVNATL